MKYITKLEDVHVVELNGRNIKIEISSYHKDSWKVYLTEKQSVLLEKETLKIKDVYGTLHLDQIVVCYELCRFLKGVVDDEQP